MAEYFWRDTIEFPTLIHVFLQWELADFVARFESILRVLSNGL